MQRQREGREKMERAREARKSEKEESTKKRECERVEEKMRRDGCEMRLEGRSLKSHDREACGSKPEK